MIASISDDDMIIKRSHLVAEYKKKDRAYFLVKQQAEKAKINLDELNSKMRELNHCSELIEAKIDHIDEIRREFLEERESLSDAVSRLCKEGKLPKEYDT